VMIEERDKREVYALVRWLDVQLLLSILEDSSVHSVVQILPS
jgi:hypothetical protein